MNKKFAVLVVVVALLAIIAILGASLHESWQNQDALSRQVIELQKTK